MVLFFGAPDDYLNDYRECLKYSVVFSEAFSRGTVPQPTRLSARSRTKWPGLVTSFLQWQASYPVGRRECPSRGTMRSARRTSAPGGNPKRPLLATRAPRVAMPGLCAT